MKNDPVMLSEAKHLVIADSHIGVQNKSEILRFAQNDIWGCFNLLIL
jgi:hypothetical protein